MTPLRLAFMGTPVFAVPALAALQAAGHDVVAVYCQPPKPAGRGQQLRASPVQALAERLGIPVRTPSTLRDAGEQAAFAALGVDLAVVAAYGLILPPPVLAAPRLGCINIHGSLLPRWRGAAPIQRAVLAGDAETGVTIMQMEAGLDTGPMLLKASVPITATTTSAGLFERLARLGAELVVTAVDRLAAGTLTPETQPEAGVTHAAKLTRAEGIIDWTQPAVDIERRLRALTPWPGCTFTAGGETIKLLAAEVVSNHPNVIPAPAGSRHPLSGAVNRMGGNMLSGAQVPAPRPRGDDEEKKYQPGTLLDDRFTVVCGQGALRLAKVQRAGRPPVDGAAYLRGYPLPVGQIL